MMEEKNSLWSVILLTIFILFIAASLFSEDESYDSIETYGYEDQSILIGESDQFPQTNELHWDHMPLTYKLDEYCVSRLNGKFERDIEEAVEFISNRTDDVVSFERIAIGEPDILFDCSVKNAGDTKAEAESYIYEGTNLFAPGKIYIYSAYDCMGKRPVITIHEILHLFGFEHKTKTMDYDVMREYYYANDWEEDASCNRDIVPEDIEYLKEVYG